MRAITVFTVCLFLPFAAVAESVAVLPVSYKVYRTDSYSEERAEKVRDAAIRGVEAAGLTPITNQEIDQESRMLAPTAEPFCSTVDCPIKVSQRAKTDLGVVVSVGDNDGQFDIHVYTTHADSVSVSHFGNLNGALNRITGMVTDTLKEALRKMPAKPKEQETEQTGPLDMSSQARDGENPENRNWGDEASPGSDLGNKKKLKPPVFWAVAGTTVAVGAGYALMEGLGYKAWKSESTPDSDKRDTVEGMQVACRALLGVTAAGVVATTILAFFTDFSRTKTEEKEDDNKNLEKEMFDRLNGEGGRKDAKQGTGDAVGKVRLLPIIGEGSGGVVIQGAF